MAVNYQKAYERLNELIKTNFYSGENSGLCQEHIDVAVNKLNLIKNKILIRSKNEENIHRGC